MRNLHSYRKMHCIYCRRELSFRFSIQLHEEYSFHSESGLARFFGIQQCIPFVSSAWVGFPCSLFFSLLEWKSKEFGMLWNMYLSLNNAFTQTYVMCNLESLKKRMAFTFVSECLHVHPYLWKSMLQLERQSVIYVTINRSKMRLLVTLYELLMKCSRRWNEGKGIYTFSPSFAHTF